MADELDFDAIEIDDDENGTDAGESAESEFAKKTPVKEVGVCLKIVLGETMMPVHELLRLGRGAVIPLNTTEDDDVLIFADEREIAGGQLRLNGEQIEVIVTEARLRGPEYRLPSDRFKKVA